MATKIAIVEDEPSIAQMYQMKFTSEGYGVETAANGQEGLKLVEKTKPDIVLLDLMMPVMSGEEMLKAMRATEWGKAIPVFILTNLGDDTMMEKLKPLRIQQYIVKANYSPSEVVGIVKLFANP